MISFGTPALWKTRALHALAASATLKGSLPLTIALIWNVVATSSDCKRRERSEALRTIAQRYLQRDDGEKIGNILLWCEVARAYGTIGDWKKSFSILEVLDQKQTNAQIEAQLHGHGEVLLTCFERILHKVKRNKK
jgi:hypothetical protein